MSQHLERYHVENYTDENIAILDRLMPNNARTVATTKDVEMAERIVRALNQKP